MPKPQTTKAFVLNHLGYDGLDLEERPIPPVQPGQVLVRMRAAALNFRDLKILKGVYARNPILPVVPLSDGAGEIVETGPAVTQFAPGDRVLPVYMEGWHTGPQTSSRAGWRSKGGEVDGTAMEYAVYDQHDVLPIADTLSFEDAACTACAGVTAWHGLVYQGHVKAGDIVLVMGSGGVSVYALQIARMSGARVIATSSDDAKLARLIALGASDGINYKRTPRWEEEVLRLTGGRGVDHVVEVGGADTMAQSVRATRDGGHIAVIGNLTGQLGSTSAAERGIRVSLIAVGSREMNDDLLRAMMLHGVRTPIDRRFPFTELKAALAYLETAQHFGKVVLTFDP